MGHQAKEKWIDIQGWDVKDSPTSADLKPAQGAPDLDDLTDGPAVEPDHATTFTAIALAESGGNTRAHNPHGEDSRGLWQINAGPAQPDINPDTVDCSELVQWASASTKGVGDSFVFEPQAMASADQATDLSPWTVTHGGSQSTDAINSVFQLMSEPPFPEPNLDSTAVATLVDFA